MKKFAVEITETLQKIILVDAQNKEDAYLKVKERYKNEDIVLSSEEYIGTEINVIGEYKSKKEKGRER